MGFISRHITPLVINSLVGRHTHANTHTHTDDPHRINFKKPGVCQPVAGVPDLKAVKLCKTNCVHNLAWLWRLLGKSIEV